MKFGFIGLGLIGGSLAKALREADRDCNIVAYDIYGKLLDEALVDRTISKACYEIDDSFDDCDFIFLCAPVTDNVENLTKIISHVSEDTILTDVGSTKRNIHEALKNIGFKGCFIGGHPMAGSEKYGYDHASASIIKGAHYILTPMENTGEDKIEKYKKLVEKIGCIPSVMDYEFHDIATGVISHLPHVISASLVHFLMSKDNDNETMKRLAAGGFRDITRTASSSVKMWEDICIANSEVLYTLLGEYITQLDDIRNMIKSKNKEEIAAFFADAKEFRDLLYPAKQK